MEKAVPPWKLAETNYGVVKGQHYEVAVLPLGATEPHNLHLPYGMDSLEGDRDARRPSGEGPVGPPQKRV